LREQACSVVNCAFATTPSFNHTGKGFTSSFPNDIKWVKGQHM